MTPTGSVGADMDNAEYNLDDDDLLGQDMEGEMQGQDLEQDNGEEEDQGATKWTGPLARAQSDRSDQDLKSSDILDHPSLKIYNEGHQAAFSGILEILTVVCELHKLPLAQTWVPCRHCTVLVFGGSAKKSCSSLDGRVTCNISSIYFFDLLHQQGKLEKCL